MNMNQDVVNQYKAEYTNKNPGEIFDLWERRASLVGEAQTALSDVIKDRQIDLQAIAAADLAERDELARTEEARETESQKRTNLFLKIFFIVTIPIVLISLLTSDRPGGLLLVGISSGVQGLVLALIVWGITKLVRKPRRK
jgi:hypothetical protein